MSNKKSAAAIVREIADEIGLRFGTTSAERGRLVADVLQAEADPESVLEVLGIGCAEILRKENTQDRRAAEGAVRAAVEGDVAGLVPVQVPLLDYPITLPGEQTMPLGAAAKPDLRAALRAITAQRQGFDRTERRLQHILDALAPFPESATVASLVASGALRLDDLFGGEQAA